MINETGNEGRAKKKKKKSIDGKEKFFFCFRHYFSFTAHEKQNIQNRCWKKESTYNDKTANNRKTISYFFLLFFDAMVKFLPATIFTQKT